MITSRQTRLHRAATLRAAHRVLADLVPPSPSAARDTLYVVPTRAAADELRRTLEHVLLSGSPDARPGLVLPDLVTRPELYDTLARRAPLVRPRLSDLEREAVLRGCAADAATRVEPPFKLRPGLLAEVLALYDSLRRRNRTVEQFDRLLGGALEESAGFDRGAARLLQQTRFLTAAFEAYEARLASIGALDEHLLREVLLRTEPARPVSRVVAAVGDSTSEAMGLWPADYDLLTRLPGLEHVDVVLTERQLDAGLLERLQECLPGIEIVPTRPDEVRPALVAPDIDEARVHFEHRDREEELVWFARVCEAEVREEGTALDGTAFVFDAPLPYLYLGRHVMASARLPFQAFDALPLASEPIAATLDLVETLVLSDWTRAALVDLLHSPHLVLPGGDRASAALVAPFDRALREDEYLGGLDELARLVFRWREGDDSAGGTSRPPGLAALGDAVLAWCRCLEPLAHERPVSDHLQCLLGFLEAHHRPPMPVEPWYERHARAYGAVTGTLRALIDAARRHGDARGPFHETAAILRRWIEAQTFEPRRGRTGPHLVDADAARFGSFHRVHLAGLVEGEWPRPAPRSILYPAGLLAALGWPTEADRHRAARARFYDLLELASNRVSVSAFALEHDSLVKPAPILEELPDAGLALARDARPLRRVLVEEALSLEPLVPEVWSEHAAPWVDLRRRRPSSVDRALGDGGPAPLEDATVTKVESYLQCPFKYFATYLLRLEEEPDDTPGLSARDRGLFVHELLERFFKEWQARGHGAIAAGNLDAARQLFHELVDDELASLSPDDRTIERARLLGSAASPGFVEQILRLEAEREGGVLERRLEMRLEGVFNLVADGHARPVRLRGTVDRVDLLDDGTCRVYDYKVGRAPDPKSRVQLPIYAQCVEHQLEGHRDRRWQVREAGYIALREPDVLVTIIDRSTPGREARDAVPRFFQALDGMADGRFPVKPVEPFRCVFCPYPDVCRKAYVGDE